ncbi:phosphoribosylformylglycinamidine synthase subunit PurS [Lacticaseibacillus mingshuiensis]|uniref:Phosphoribosylformylglycinamidine synthase subunit PurS n=1 Tax=Lacticaseibacillus mingshuiensis TaxID=2799574 RepID=A0ABW4CGJ2_9LACO|nr:phosphoribosylformylglycinamidine synthase subunit PurS [Lacticaseibacillus mingshuiensis]
MFKAKIFVNYKPSVLDPKAEVIQNTLARLGDDNVQHVLVGKYFELLLSGDEAAVRAQIDRICDTMLANINTESYRFTLEPVSDAAVAE